MKIFLYFFFHIVNIPGNRNNHVIWSVMCRVIINQLLPRNGFYSSYSSISGIGGTVKAITRKQLVDYYTAHYTPNNMIISIAGNVNNVKEKIEKYFHELKPKKIIVRAKVNEPVQNAMKKVVRKKKTLNSYMVLGYKAVPRMHKDSYVLDVITGILGRGQSGWMFDEIRNKRGLAYQVGINNESEKDYGMFAVYTNLDKKNIGKAKEIIMQQFRKLGKVTKLDIDEAKTFIEGNYTLQMEDNFHLTDNFSFWDTIKDAKLANSYINNIKKVTAEDVKRIAAEYFTDKYTLVVIAQE